MNRFVVTLILCGCVLVLSGCKEQILHQLTETESNRLITRLHEAGIEAEKRSQPDGSWALAVDSSSAIEALSVLSDARVFRNTVNRRESKSGMMLPSRESQRFQYERAIANEVETTLSALSGVLEARVHLHLPPTDPLFGHQVSKSFPSSASVLLVADKDFRGKKEEIQALVGGASGISQEAIAVLFSTPGIENEDSIAQGAEPLGATKEISQFAVEDTEKRSAPVDAPRKNVSADKDSIEISRSLQELLIGSGVILLLVLVLLGFVRARIPVKKRRHKKPPNFEQHLEGLAYREGEAI